MIRNRAVFTLLIGCAAIGGIACGMQDGDAGGEESVARVSNQLCSSGSLAITTPKFSSGEYLLAASADCQISNPHYAFWAYGPSGWELLRSYTEQNTFTWSNPTSGKYKVVAQIREADSAVWQEARAEQLLTVGSATPCTAVTGIAALENGDVTTLSAQAEVCPSAEFQYWTQSAAGVWSIRCDWTAGGCAWNTSAVSMGSAYTVVVLARQAGFGSGEEARGTAAYVKGGAPTPDACESVSLTATSNAPGSVHLVADVVGSCASPEYMFWRYSSGGWTILRAYNSSGTIDTSVSGLSGSLSFVVQARQTGTVVAEDSRSTALFDIDPRDPCTGVTLGVAGSAGGPITMTAGGTACAAPEYRFWRLSPAGTWTVVCGWQQTSDCVWNTAGADSGNWKLVVQSRQLNVAVDEDSRAAQTLSLP